MDKVAIARINTFGISPKADFGPSSEEAVFVLTSGQLSALITQAVEKAIQPLQDEVMQLRATVDRQDEKIAAMEARIALQEDNGLIQLRLINDLREAAKKEAQPMQKDRSDILRALLAANGGKMLAKDARQKMHLIKPRFSELLATMKDDIEIRPYHLKKNQKLLVLK
jgi:hypothetical protein